MFLQTLLSTIHLSPSMGGVMLFTCSRCSVFVWHWRRPVGRNRFAIAI